MRDRNAPLTAAEVDALAWDKMDGMLPAVVQDAGTGQVLMLGYMDRAALEATLESGFATFFSRSKARLWQKGETSGNRLRVVTVRTDCDEDALLVEADHRAARTAAANIETLGLAGAEVRHGRVERVVADGLPGPAYDVVFADPPYGLADDDLAAVLQALRPALAERAVVAVERATRGGD